MVELESSKLFRGLSGEDLDLMRSTMQVREVPADATIFKEGEQGDGMYVIRDGGVQISMIMQGGENKALTKLRPGDYFGEMAIIDNEPRSASATAIGQTSLYYFPREAVLQALQQSPLMSVRLVREFSHRMREFNRHYVEEALQAERLTLVGRFARSIVHDFKNPLNVIGLAAELAGMETATPAMRANASLRIRKQVDRLGNMINELLEFTRSSHSSMVLAGSNYARFIKAMLEELGPETAERNVEIVCEEPPDVEVLIDPQRLTHVFLNLIHNSVDAMPVGGKIFVRFRVANDEVITELEDTGKGFAPEIVPRLFEAFATFGKATGTGLGLSICRKIITDHKGHIEAQAVPGRGAIFTFGLPIPKP